MDTNIPTDMQERIALILETIGLGDDTESFFSISEINYLSTRDACIYSIEAIINGDHVSCTGTSRRCPGDRHDSRLGQMLALTRAFENLTKALQRRANGLVKHNDDIAAARPAQKANSRAYRETIAKIASNDPKVQREAIRQIREKEGTFVPRQQTRSAGECV